MNQSKRSGLVVALKWTVMNGSTKGRFEFFLEFLVRGRINCFFDKFLILLSCIYIRY